MTTVCILKGVYEKAKGSYAIIASFHASMAGLTKIDVFILLSQLAGTTVIIICSGNNPSMHIEDKFDT